MPDTVSACLIVRDEEARLPACLATLGLCDEVVVVDSGSRDRTVAVARAAGARVVENRWPGFAAQRNVAIDHARGDWVLEIDADERLVPGLQEELRAFLTEPPAGFEIAAMPRRNIFLGRPLGPAAKYPEYRFRLFRRGAYRHDERRLVHEGLRPQGPVWPFEHELEHLLAGTLKEAFRDAWNYSRLEAGHLPFGPATALWATGGRPVAKLVYRLAVDGAWRDGWRGALKVVLDCGSDAVAAGRRLAVTLGATRAAPPPARGGAAVPPAAALPHPDVRLIGLAAGRAAARQTAGWLSRAAMAGADVSLITDAPEAAWDGVRLRTVSRLGPLHTIRALDAESQLRAADALVVTGARARGLLRVVPPRLRPALPALTTALAPERAAREVRAALDAAEGTAVRRGNLYRP